MINDQYHPISIGKKIERARRFKGMKQEALAEALGVTRQSVSKLEQSEEIDEEKLKEVAAALGITVEDIKNFPDEVTAFNIQNMNDNSQAIYHYTFNPLLQSEREKVAMLEKMLEKHSK